MYKTLEERFNKYKKIQNSCWLWMGEIKASGYGQFTLEKKSTSVHRASYSFYKGPIPMGMFVCHSCDNRSCFNPDHLFLGTHKENMADMISKNRQSKGVNNPKSKLDISQILALRDAFNAGFKMKAIARYFNISDKQVSNIGRRKHWTHI